MWPRGAKSPAQDADFKYISTGAMGAFRLEGIFACTRDTALMTAALSDAAARCKIACTGRAFKYPQARWEHPEEENSREAAVFPERRFQSAQK